MRRTIRAAAVMAALALALLAGCGNDDRVNADNAYVEQTNRAVQAFETQFQQLQTSFTPVSTPAQDRRTLVTLRQTVDRAAAQLQRIQAPPRLATLHARLITELQGYDAVIATARKRFAVEDPQRVATARTQLSTELAVVATKVAATINHINRRLQ
jgi:outer membrane murein-binding lipoprotein Lpp